MNERLSIGARYLMKVNMDYSGTAHFTQVNTGIIIPATITIPVLGTIPAGTPLDGVITSLGLFSTGGLLADQTATASIANPDMFVAGVAYKATDKLTLLADYQWVHWSHVQRAEPHVLAQHGAQPDADRELHRTRAGSASAPSMKPARS